MSARLGSRTCPARNGQRAATIVLATRWRSLKLSIVRRTTVHRLPQATRVRRRGGDRQSHWHEHSHQQQNQQQSGCRTMHRLQTLSRRSNDKLASAREQFTTIDENRGHRVCQIFDESYRHWRQPKDNTVYACLFHQHPTAAIGEKDDQVHHHQHRVIVPTVSFLAPESCMPDEDFFLNRAEHDQNQSQRSELSEHTKSHAQSSRQLRRPEKNSKAFAHADALASLLGLGKVTPSAADEDHRDHEPEREQSEVGELSELREHCA